MKNLLFICYFFLSIHSLKAQSRSESIAISGNVENSLNLTTKDLQQMNVVNGTDFKVVSTSGEVRKEFKTYKGILLSELLDKAKIVLQSPKEKGKIYFVATATDGYTAIFSYHEIFNNPAGDKVLVLFEENEKLIDKDGAFVLISATDKITGARHVKCLQSIEVRRL